jgi:hypothetical protein
MMRQSSAIILLLVYLSVNTELQEIARIPVLFEHFAEHRQKNTEVSFIDFIVLHYFSGDIRGSDYQRDQQLPFKSMHCEGVTNFIAIPAEPVEALLPKTCCTLVEAGMYVSQFNSSLFQFTIWQPPRA